jgi:hypothetical protein
MLIIFIISNFLSYCYLLYASWTKGKMKVSLCLNLKIAISLQTYFWLKIYP